MTCWERALSTAHDIPKHPIFTAPSCVQNRLPGWMFYELTTVTHHYAVDNKSIVEPLKSVQNLLDNMSQLFFAVWILNTRR